MEASSGSSANALREPLASECIDAATGQPQAFPMASATAYPLKRALDLLVATFALVLMAPVFVVVFALIKVSDGGPAIFWQRRVGRNGREFWCPKFRSMRVGSEHLHDFLLDLNLHRNSITFKMRHDPRMTAIGQLIRTLSIDELPQLWSVLRGDMSLVGPRPPLPGEVARYTPFQRRRLAVKPGLTCIWQVSGRSTIPFQRQVEMDVEYIEHQSLSLDLKLLLMTVPAVLSCRGAY